LPSPIFLPYVKLCSHISKRVKRRQPKFNNPLSTTLGLTEPDRGFVKEVPSVKKVGCLLKKSKATSL
jgi:hypothetical protein